MLILTPTEFKQLVTAIGNQPWYTINNKGYANVQAIISMIASFTEPHPQVEVTDTQIKWNWPENKVDDQPKV